MLAKTNRLARQNIYESDSVRELVNAYEPRGYSSSKFRDESLAFVTEGVDRSDKHRRLFTRGEETATLDITREQPELLLTIFGYSLAGLLSGAFIVENIMAWPGLGRLTIEALFAKDFQLVVATVVMATGLLVAGNFIADILLAWSDPRIRLKE